ncbi:hypothetical protein MTO96_024257 [Rhipicephalus appendiculatus]
MPAVGKTLEEHCKAASSTPKRSVPSRKNRCGLCEACLASECKVCMFCRNMKKYGGPGTFKQCCVRRRCQQRHLLDSIDCAGTDSMDQEVSTLPDEPFAQREFVKRYGIETALKLTSRSLKGTTFFYRFQCHVTTCTFTEANAECPHCPCAQQQKCAKTLAYLPNRNGDCFFVKPSAIRMPLNPKLSETTPEDSSAQGLSGDEFTERCLEPYQSGKASLQLSDFKRGEINLVCGSPSFESAKCSDGQPLSNSQLATFLGFCEFYDPWYVVLVAERRVVKYRNGSGLAFALKCLLDLGYQTSCSMLQDGCYGIPQRHRRLVIFGAKKGLAKLPAFPPATHAFDVPERHLSFAVDGRAYASPLAATSAAPYPRTTLRDAIGDLGRGDGAAPVTDFIRFFGRRGASEASARAPRTVRLSATPCTGQENTLIPWSLVHTGHRSGQWSGVYGRLQWDGYLHGVVVNPEPLSKQGPVIHPEEDRVISVRECARIQGYPDDFVFVGPTLERYKMIAGSVAPLLALALGRAIAQQLH